MRKALTETLIEIAKSDPRLVLMTADLGFMVLEPFQERFPDRFFNVGVAEANMVGLATGLASCGYIPYVYSIATFASMRAYEQVRNGPVLHRLPVRIVGIGGGFEYGYGGITHHALEDLAIARVQPGLSVVAPADADQARNAIRVTYDLPGPVYLRLGKRDDYAIPKLDGRFRLGRCEVVRKGGDLVILSLGSITQRAVDAAENLAVQGIHATVVVVSSLRPAPTEDIAELLLRCKLAVTVEEHYVEGGLGSLVAEVLSERGINCTLVRCGVKEPAPIGWGSEDYLRDVAGLSAEQLTKTMCAALGVSPA